MRPSGRFLHTKNPKPEHRLVTCPGPQGLLIACSLGSLLAPLIIVHLPIFPPSHSWLHLCAMTITGRQLRPKPLIHQEDQRNRMTHNDPDQKNSEQSTRLQMELPILPNAPPWANPSAFLNWLAALRGHTPQSISTYGLGRRFHQTIE